MNLQTDEFSKTYPVAHRTFFCSGEGSYEWSRGCHKKYIWVVMVKLAHCQACPRQKCYRSQDKQTRIGAHAFPSIGLLECEQDRRRVEERLSEYIDYLHLHQ